MEVTAAPRRPSSFMKSIFMTRPPNNVPSCNATSGQLSLHHHDDPELQEPAAPPTMSLPATPLLANSASPTMTTPNFRSPPCP